MYSKKVRIKYEGLAYQNKPDNIILLHPNIGNLDFQKTHPWQHPYTTQKEMNVDFIKGRDLTQTNPLTCVSGKQVM